VNQSECERSQSALPRTLTSSRKDSSSDPAARPHRRTLTATALADCTCTSRDRSASLRPGLSLAVRSIARLARPSRSHHGRTIIHVYFLHAVVLFHGWPSSSPYVSLGARFVHVRRRNGPNGGSIAVQDFPATTDCHSLTPVRSER
jgi:hypothetical protein